MTKLTLVESELRKNQGIYVVTTDGLDMVVFPASEAPYNQNHRFTFRVAPKHGLYVEKDLNDLMDNLVQGICPDEVTPFKRDRGLLTFGSLEFHEIIGNGVKETDERQHLNEGMLLNRNGAVNGDIRIRRTVEYEINAVVEVVLYPDRDFAERGYRSVRIDDIVEKMKLRIRTGR